MLAEVNSTAGLGPIGALGVGLAMIFMLTMLPAALTIFGRRAFWPFIPYGPSGGEAHGPIAGRLHRFSHQTDETHGTWRRVGEWVAQRPRAVAGGTIAVLLIFCLGFVQLDTGLTNGNSFRGEVEAVKGNELLAGHFPAGANVPSTVIVPRGGDVRRSPTRSRPTRRSRTSGARRRARPARSSRSSSRPTRTRPRRSTRSRSCATSPSAPAARTC